LYLFEVLSANRRFEEAEQVYRNSLPHTQKLVADASNRGWYWKLLLFHFRTYGEMQARMGRTREAEAAFREAMAIGERFVADIANDGRADPRIDYTCLALGNLLNNSGRAAEALVVFRRGLNYALAAVTARPNIVAHYQTLASLFQEISLLPTDVYRFDEAQEFYRRIFPIFEQFAATFPTHSSRREQIALVHGSWANQCLKYGQLAEAEHAWRRAGIEWEKLMADFHDVLTTAHAHISLARLLAAMPEPRLRDPARAVELAKKAVELSPKAHSAWNTLGVAQYRIADWKGAIDAFEKSMELRRGGDGRDWFFLAMAYYQSGSSVDLPPEEKERQRTQAREWYDRAVEWMNRVQPADTELIQFRAEAAELLERGSS
jgi:tetratricopeptide (TPR) repeat protein